MALRAQNLKPFVFERSFDEPSTAALKREAEALAKAQAEAAEAEAEPIAPTFSEEELEAAKAAARAEGYADGHAEGHAEAEGEAQAEISRALEVVAQEVARLAERQRLANDQQEAALARVAAEIMGKLVPVYVEAHGTDEAVDVVRDCMRTLQDAGRLTVRCSAEESDKLRELLDDVVVSTGFEGQLRIIPDPSMGRSDVFADWGAGGAQRRFEDIWADIAEAVETSITTVQTRLQDAAFSQHAGEAPTTAKATVEDETDGTDTPAHDMPMPEAEEISAGDEDTTIDGGETAPEQMNGDA